jgi:hypothetical protein
VVSLTTWPFLTPEKKPAVSVGKEAVWTKKKTFWTLKESKVSFALGIETRFLGRPAPVLDAIVTELCKVLWFSEWAA